MSCARVLLPLPASEAHLFYVETHAITQPEVLEAYDALLNDEERGRRDRYKFARHRHEFLVTRALVRTVLSLFAPIEPKQWQFRSNSHGRPEVSTHEGRHLKFNLSNTDGLVACLVATDRHVGVDVERMDREGETVEIADQFFAPSEVAALLALPTHQRRLRFLEYWTLKEAYIKARGLGLSVPLHEFSFDLAGDVIRISFTERLKDDQAAWQFQHFRPTNEHLLATAIPCTPGESVTVLARPFTPLVSVLETL
ncbi:MAG: 4'-phosphopantetheinyl transferase superfamily protein [Polyangiales bacterium]